MDLSILEELGLSKGETRAYVVLLRSGSSKVGPIIERSGMASSAVHNALNSLRDKGLVSHVKRGAVKQYLAVPPRQLIDFVDDKKRRLQRLLPELEVQQKLAEERQEAEIFEGAKGIMAMLTMLIDGTRKGDEYLFFSIDVEERNEEIQKFFHHYDAKRAERGIRVRGLAPRKMEGLFAQRRTVMMKYPAFPVPANISVCGERVALFSWGEKAVGYLITSPQIAGMYRSLFERIWSEC